MTKNQPAKTPNDLTIGLHETEDGVVQMEISGPWIEWRDMASSPKLARHIIQQIWSLGDHGRRIDEQVSNAVVGFVTGMKPRDPAEMLLLTQMGAIHNATMMLARGLNHVDSLPQQDLAERALNKLARTFAAQMDTLKRYRSKGQQTVRVERVTVQDGGQAIVGTVESGGAGPR